MSNSATEITNLLYRYAELMDAGELEGAAELFSHARIKTQGGVLDNLQATATLPLQVIAAGRYHDEFERENGIWRFSFRDYSMLDLKGDLSHHLTLIFA